MTGDVMFMLIMAAVVAGPPLLISQSPRAARAFVRSFDTTNDFMPAAIAVIGWLLWRAVLILLPLAAFLGGTYLFVRFIKWCWVG